MHILQDCDEVKEFWLAVLNSDQISKIFSLGLEAWLKWNLTDPTVGSLHTSWQTLFGVAVRLLLVSLKLMWMAHIIVHLEAPLVEG